MQTSRGMRESFARGVHWPFMRAGCVVPACLVLSLLLDVSAAHAFAARPIWAVDGVPISTAAGGQGVGAAEMPGIVILPDGAGGVFMAWEDGGSGSVMAQRLNAAGQTLWSATGIVVAPAAGYQMSPRAVSDGTGGIIVAWVDGRNGFCGSGFLGACDIFAQRLDGAGQRVWPSGGVPVTTADANQGTSGIAIVSDGAGGAILAWEDARPPHCCQVFAQRINAAGQPVWAVDGIPISPPPTYVIGPIGTPPRSVADGAGGAIIAWLNVQVDPGTIALQRVDSNGQTLWTAGGISAGVPRFMTAGSLIPDGAGGLILAWSTPDPNSFGKLMAQRVDAAGQPLWQVGGVPIAAAPANRSQIEPDVVSDGAGGAIIVWEDERDATDHCWQPGGNCSIYAQRVSPAGQTVWPAGGVPVSTVASTQLSLRAVEDGSGGAIVTWQDCRDYRDLYACGFNTDLYAQRVSPAGQTLWPADGIPVSLAPGNQGIPPGTPYINSLVIATDGAGGAFLAWPDGRNGLCQGLTPGCDVFAQRISDQVAPFTAIIAVTPPTLAFGLATVGGAVDRTVTVRNAGVGTLTGSASASAPFSVVGGSPFSLGAGQTQVVTVHFSPTAAGTFGATLNVTSDGGTVSRSLTGTGTTESTSPLTVTLAGTGRGTVTSSPEGIDCGLDCAEYYPGGGGGGLVVNLYATPASGATFAGWSGACSGMTSCTVTMATPVAVTATFAWSSAPAAVATLVSPSGNLGTAAPTYTWNAVSTATSYSLWVTDSTGTRLQRWYTEVEAGCPGGTGTCSVMPAITLAPGEGRWSVQTRNAAGDGPRSSELSFTAPAAPTFFWQHATSGDVYLWTMNGTTQTGGTYLARNMGAWKVVATGDFCGNDGSPDLLWQHETTGDVSLWCMSGTTLTSGTYLAQGMGPWKVVAAPDLNGDGKPDLLWQHQTSGDVYYWLLTGTTPTGAGYLASGLGNWKVVATADLNDDGKPDLVWQDATTSDVYVWFMNGTTVSSGAYLARNMGAWKVVGPK